MSQITGLSQLKATTNLSHLDINSSNEVKKLTPLGKIGRDIADAFRSLSDSGRSKIATRNEAVAKAIQKISDQELAAGTTANSRKVMHNINNQVLSLTQELVAKASKPYLAQVANQFGKNSDEFKRLDTLCKQAGGSPFARALGNIKFATSVLMDRTDKFTNYTQKSLDGIKTQLQAEFAKNKAAPPKNDVTGIFFKDAKRGMTASFDGAPVARNQSSAMYEQLLRNFVGEDNKDYVGALSFICSQAGITGLVLDQGAHADGFDFGNGMSMNVMPSHDPEDMAASAHSGKATLRQDANNFYVSTETAERYYFGFDYEANKDDGIKLTNDASITLTIPKGQVAPHGAEKFLPDFSVQARSVVHVG
ncbi:MAG: hypothetical protein R3Y11_00310 [Pseudomonadota bacterium]